MNRSSFRFTQGAFDLANKLAHLSAHASRQQRFAARLARRFVKPILRRIGANQVVSAKVFGRFLQMPAEHPLPAILAEFPQHNRPLGLAIEAITRHSAGDHRLAVIDVGANIGDTIAILEERCPGICLYLCLEADRRLADLCRLNHSDNTRVIIKQCFIGEEEGTAVRLQDDGRANPSTKLASIESTSEATSIDRLVRLDSAAKEFVETNGCLSLIKIDTEGYDFSVLRSGPNLLKRYRPAIYFEWFPRLLIGLNEKVWSGFEYLATFGYRHFVFFTNKGDYYCKISDPDRLFLRSLSSVSLSNPSLGYFDVFATADLSVCDELVHANIAVMDGCECARSLDSLSRLSGTKEPTCE